jgi:hypothetical protein
MAQFDVTVAYHLTFWTDLVAVILISGLIALLRYQRQAALKGSSGAAQFVILPIYEYCLWAGAVTYLVQTLLLGVPGPYPSVPQWFLGATYLNHDLRQQWSSSGLYWGYWFTFEVGDTPLTSGLR